MRPTHIAVKRMHGLGDLLMLLPVLAKASEMGRNVSLLTRDAWWPLVEAACPRIRTTPSANGITHDLDQLTATTRPTLHRTEEFGRLLAVEPPFPTLDLSGVHDGAPSASGAVVLAPEAGHAARRWPYCMALADRLARRPLWLVGLSPLPTLPCDADLRGRLDVLELVRVVAAARCAISMDSGVLQIALATRTPVVAIFGGIDPAFRVRPRRDARPLVGQVACRPCNKRETCRGRFDCLRSISVDAVIAAVEDLLDDRSHATRGAPRARPPARSAHVR